MTLLTAVVDNPIDPGYLSAAREAPKPKSNARKIGVCVLAIALGLGTAIAVKDLRKPVPAVADRRALLESEITGRSKQADFLEESNLAVQFEIDRLQSSLLGETDIASTRVSVAAGTVKVQGSGIVVRLSDAESDSEGAVPQEGLVRDRDLQVVVNGLWAAGAEAISINGRRLTSVSAIRNAGQAVLVDLQPVLQPYLIRAIGDSAGLQTGMAQVGAGRYLQSLQDNLRIKVSIDAEKSLTLDSAVPLGFQFAHVPKARSSPRPTVSSPPGSGDDS